jgi:hypothetical protein
MKPIVSVTWVDSMRVQLGWAEEDRYTAAMEGLVCRTAGFLIAQDGDNVMVALSTYEDGSMIETAMVIPRSAIKRMDLWAPRSRGPRSRGPR